MKLKCDLFLPYLIRLKKEATDLETQKKKAMQNYLSSNKMESFDKLHRNARIFAFTNASRSPRVRYPKECDNDTMPTSSAKRISIYPVTKGSVTNEPLDVKSASHIHQRSNRNSLVTENISVNHVVQITVPRSSTGSEVRRRSMLVRENSMTTAHSDNLMTAGAVNASSVNTPINLRRSSSIVPQLTTPIIRVEDVSGTEERLKTAATVPLRRPNKAMDQRSVRTLPTLLPSQNSVSGTNPRANRPKTSSLWPGDPNAIRSVRRDRRKPEEMLSSVKNGEEARRMIRDMPPTCSKNCSKPDIMQELGRSYTDLPNLLPAIEKARHALARQEAASRDVPEDNLNENEEGGENGNEKGVMPVSQIQYTALRSLGGIRRNSVIA